MDKLRRHTIFVEEAEILAHEAFDGNQHMLRLLSPRVAAAAMPGSFIHVRCDPLLAMRRPMSIMRANPERGWVEFLFKVVGTGTRFLAEKSRGDSISVMGPIGSPFQLNDERPRALLMGGGVGIPPMVFLAERMCKQHRTFRPFVIMGSEVPFPFRPRPSQILLPGLPDGVIACMPLLEDLGIPSRLASLQGYPGCFEGYITELARAWLESLDEEGRTRVQIFACGPTPMLRAVAKLAANFELPCQVSLEEFMACAVGGCAGCTVLAQTPDGPAMKRVCVDGPVFEARSVFFE